MKSHPVNCSRISSPHVVCGVTIRVRKPLRTAIANSTLSGFRGAIYRFYFMYQFYNIRVLCGASGSCAHDLWRRRSQPKHRETGSRYFANRFPLKLKLVMTSKQIIARPCRCVLPSDQTPIVSSRRHAALYLMDQVSMNLLLITGFNDFLRARLLRANFVNSGKSLCRPISSRMKACASGWLCYRPVKFSSETASSDGNNKMACLVEARRNGYTTRLKESPEKCLSGSINGEFKAVFKERHLQAPVHLSPPRCLIVNL